MLLGKTAAAPLFNGVLTNQNDSIVNVKHKHILNGSSPMTLLVNSGTGRDW
jgi:hypothetical protein